MTVAEQVFTQAVLLAGELDGQQTDLLRALSTASASSLSSRLREGVTPEDCRGDFVTAASLLALACLSGADSEDGLEEFKAGDLTVKKAGNFNGAARCLQRQGEMLIKPYVKDCFSFLGV